MAADYVGPWPIDPLRVRPLRQAVLRPAQPPQASVYPGDDDSLTLHTGIFLGNDVVACGSLFAEDGWRIRGMATLEEHRGKGLGRQVLAALVGGASERGGGRVWCNVRTTSQGFYEANGFVGEGEVFPMEDLGPHRLMIRHVEAAPFERGFTLTRSRLVLERTPRVLDAWLRGVPAALAEGLEAPGLWSVRDLVGHLVHGEEDDWIVRVEHVMGPRAAEAFRPFERYAMVRRFAHRDLDWLLGRFLELRTDSLKRLDALGLSEDDLDRSGRHPEFGEVRLRELLAAWTAHDLSHLAQTARILAAPLAQDVGPWARFIRIVRP
jgi:GNAT superfamily N-acetyltransferase